MIPCSKLEEILQDYIENEPDPLLMDINVKKLAAFITSKSFDVYKEERAPKEALLHAAVIVIEQRQRAWAARNLARGLTIGHDGYEKKSFVWGGEDEHGALYYAEGANLIDAIIAYAEASG